MADELDSVFPDPEMPDASTDMELEQSVTPIEPEVVQQVEPEPIAAPEPQNVQPEQARPEPGFVPISAMLEERDRRRAAEEAVLRYQQTQPQRQQLPDPLDDLDGFNGYYETRMNEALTAQKFQMSDVMAKQVHGPEAVEAAVGWAQQRATTDPVFAASYMREPHPIDWIVQQHKQQDVLSQIGNRSLDDFVKDYVSKNPGIVAPAVPQQASPPARVPRSLATLGSGPSDVREVATGPLAGVDAVFSQ